LAFATLCRFRIVSFLRRCRGRVAQRHGRPRLRGQFLAGDGAPVFSRPFAPLRKLLVEKRRIVSNLAWIYAPSTRMLASTGAAKSAPRMPAVWKPTMTPQMTTIGCRLTKPPMMRGTRMLFSSWLMMK